MPDLHFALQETGSPFEYISAVETELRKDKTGEEKILPKENCKVGNLPMLVKSLDEFLIKNKNIFDSCKALKKLAKTNQHTDDAAFEQKVAEAKRRIEEEKARAEKEAAERKTATAKIGTPSSDFLSQDFGTIVKSASSTYIADQFLGQKPIAKSSIRPVA